MAQTEANNAAFARPAYLQENSGTLYYAQEGLTKREYFAAIALQGLLASDTRPGEWNVEKTNITRTAVKFADKLIEELNKPK